MFHKISKIFSEIDPLNGTLDFGNKPQTMFERSVQDYFLADKDKRTILHRAALEQNPKLIKDILDGFSTITISSLSDYINLPDQYGLTPVLMSCFSNYNQRSECLRLFSAEANFNTFNPRTLWAPIHWVAYYGDIESLVILIEKKVILFKQDYQGYYPQDLSGRNDKKECTQLIIDQIMTILVEYERMKSATYRSQHLYEYEQLSKYEEYLNNPMLKVSLFYWSCYFKLNIGLFKQFQQRFYSFGPYLETTPIHIAVKKNYVEAIDLIIEQLKVPLLTIFANKPTYYDNRIFRFTKDNVNTFKEEYKKKVLKFHKWENKYHYKKLSPLNQRDVFGNTPLHLASIENSAELVLKFIQQGCQVDIENKELWTPQDLTTDKEIIKIFNENETSKQTLIKSISSYLQVCDLLVNKQVKNPKKFCEHINQADKAQVNQLIEKLYLGCENLITPDIVLKCDNSQQSKLNFQISLLINAKFQVYITQSVFNDSTYIMLKYPLQELQLQAIIQKMEVKLIDSFDYEPFDLGSKESFEPFRSQQRQEIIEKHLSRIINIPELVEQQLIQQVYRMHSFGGTAKIKHKWIDEPKWWWPQPFSQIKDYLREGSKNNFDAITLIRLYYGEKIAFFFAFKSYLTCIQIFVAIPGAALQIYILASGHFDTIFVPLWVIYLSLWSTIIVEIWKRKSCEINARWGMLDQMNSDAQSLRQEFSGDEEMNLITSEVSKYYRRIYTVVVFSISIPFLIIFTSLIIGLFLAIDYFQTANSITSVYYKVVVGIIQGLCIAILNITYSALVNFFVEKENHKFEENYEFSLIYKNVLFKFMNSYLTVFYTAYFKYTSTYEELFYLLLPVLIIKQCSYIMVTVIVPQLIYKYKEDKYFQNLSQREQNKKVFQDSVDILWKLVTNSRIHSIPRCVINLNTGQSNSNFDIDAVELNAEKLNATSNITINNFMECMIDFGYVSLFAAAFPIGPLISMIMGVIEVRMKIFTFIYVYKKPAPQRASGIGEWLFIWEALSFSGVFTNYALLFLKQEDEINSFLFPDGPIKIINMMWLFILVVFLNALLKYLLQLIIPDKPTWVSRWEEELKQKKKSQSKMAEKEQECEKLYMRISALERQNFKLQQQTSSIDQDQNQQIQVQNNRELNLLPYFQIERDLLLQRLNQIKDYVYQKKVLILLCSECQKAEAGYLCQECQLQFCGKCINDFHNSINVKHKSIIIFPSKQQKWRKLEYFGFPTSQGSAFYQDFKDAYDSLSAFYEGKNILGQFLNNQNLGIEDKLFLNRIMHLLHKKEKQSLGEFIRQSNILNTGTVEQKILQFVEFLDEDNDSQVSLRELQHFMAASFLQDTSFQQKSIQLFDGHSMEKKDLIRKLLIACQNQSQTKEYLISLLQC